jgi:hypothetical protein
VVPRTKDSDVGLSDPTRILAAILLFSLVTVETGGLYLMHLARRPGAATPFQLAFARAGHAHAGVLLILSLVGLLFADATDATGTLGAIASLGIPVAALLMPAGFFFSSIGAERTSPNRAVALVYLGGLSLAVGLTALGVALLTAT